MRNKNCYEGFAEQEKKWQGGKKEKGEARELEAV